MVGGEAGDGLPGSSRRRYLALRRVLFDRVTGLPAFPVLIERLRGMLEKRRCIGVVHLEIDNLELVESLYGWQVFDRILARVADALRRSVGVELPTDTLVGLERVGGDRFAAFVPQGPAGEEASPEFLAGSAAALQRRLEQTFLDEEFAGLSPRLEFRTGCARLSPNPFYRFERRVYAALAEARGWHDRRDRRRAHVLDAELRRIIEGDGLDAVFQPVVDLGSRDVVGYEVLARGPKGTLLETPGAMFAISDRLGIAVQLDRACREAALRACACADCPGKIFLNALPASFPAAEGPGGEDPCSLLGSLGRPPGEVVLEFPERAADPDPRGFVATLGRLQERGFGIALDDVGTGLAGPAVLDELRPDFLKLDVGLVREIHRNLIKQEILRSLIRIAKRMGASVIAEGVETEEEAAVLCAAGAHLAQGYLFARPAPRTGDPPGNRPGGIGA